MRGAAVLVNDQKGKLFTAFTEAVTVRALSRKFKYIP